MVSYTITIYYQYVLPSSRLYIFSVSNFFFSLSIPLTFLSVCLLYHFVALSVHLCLCLSFCLSPPLCLLVSCLILSSLASLLTPPSPPFCEIHKKDFLILSISISSFSPRLLGLEECIVHLQNTLCDIINLFLVRAFGWRGVRPVGD